VAAKPFTLSHLEELEAEAVHIMREVAAERERPVLLFSGGKDSIVLLRLAEKAFRPGKFPFPVMHVDTGHNFPEVIEFRDRRVAEPGGGPQRAGDPGAVGDPAVGEESGATRPGDQPELTSLAVPDDTHAGRRSRRRRPPRRGGPR